MSHGRGTGGGRVQLRASPPGQLWAPGPSFIRLPSPWTRCHRIAGRRDDDIRWPRQPAPTKPRRPGRWLLVMDSFERGFGTTRKNTNLGPCDKTTTLEGASCSLAGRPVGGVAGVWGPLEGVISWLLRQPIRGKTAPPSRPLGTSRGPPNTHPDATCQSLRPPARILQQRSPPCACALPSPLPPQRGVVHAEQSRIHPSRRPFSQMPPLRRIASSSPFSSIRRRGSGRIAPARFVGGTPHLSMASSRGTAGGKSYLTCRTPQPMTTPWDWPRWTVDCGVKG